MERDARSSDADEELVDGRYRLLKLLGKGGMGSVHLALDQSTGQEVALKRLLSQQANDVIVSLFEREYRALASLRHPRIVRVYEYGVDRAGPYYTMELLEGEDLSQVAPMPWREVCGCLRDAASILGVLHARRLIHRDLNPRNLWRTPDGRLKLLDFGALAPFGVSDEVVGAPPLVAPESLHREPLDGRTDLYTLGALGYWLLTSNHAFPVRSVHELPALWERDPARPSSLVRLIKDADHDVPAAVDELLMGLMRVDPDERPQRIADVIDTLNDAAELPPESEDVVVSGYLENAAFVGRHQLRSRFERSLTKAQNGKVVSHFVAGAGGMGRSRLLAELALNARLSGASVVELRGREGGDPYALAVELCKRLSGILPQAAREAVRPFARELRGLGGGLADLIEPLEKTRRASEETRAFAASDPNQQRVERQRALAGFVRTLALDRTLVITVDDVHLADQESMALLAELAGSSSDHRLVLVSSIVEERVEKGLSTLGKLREVSRRWSLEALGPDEARELMCSLFGEVPLLDRFSARLHELSGGRPDHLLMLARHLVGTGVIRYAEGSWVIPLELPSDLPTSTDAGALVQLENASAGARSLAKLLAVPDHGPLSRAMVRALWSDDADTLEGGLAELVDLGLVRRVPEGVYMHHAALRERLWAALDEQTQQSVHRTLGGLLQSETNASSLVRAGLHYVRAGDIRAAQRPLAGAVRRALEHADAGVLRVMAPTLAEVDLLLREADAEEHLRVSTLAGLGMAGYLVDGEYAVRYGDEARRVLEDVLCMPLARRLQPVVGRKLGLLLALVTASLMLSVRRSELKGAEVIQWFVTIMSSVVGTMASYIDNDGVRRFANALEPFTALGPNHIATFAHHYGLALAHGAEDTPYLSLTAMQAHQDRLESPEPIEGLDPLIRSYMIGGCLLSNGIRMSFAARRETLEIADALARIGPLQDMQADYLRSFYYATRGDRERAQHFKQSLENKAVQLGNCWQAEVTGPSSEMIVHVVMHDAAAVKRGTREIEAIAARIPSLAHYVVDGHRTYAHLRDRHERVVELTEAADEAPLAQAGWAQQRGLLAAAYNRLGQHARAREVCVDALARLSAEDLDFVLMNLGVRVELAVAEAALGQREEAKASLEAMLSEYHDRGPLVRGFVLQALLQVARDADDLDAFESYLERLEECYEPLRVPSLRSLCARYEAELRARRNPGDGLLSSELATHDSHLHTRVNLMLTQAGSMTSERAAVGIQLAVELTAANGGCVIQLEEIDPLASTGVEADTSALDWARERLQSTTDDDVTAVETEEGPGDADQESTLELRDAVYTLTLLWHPGRITPVAALLLRFAENRPKLLPDGLRSALAQHLLEGQSDSEVDGERGTRARPA